MSGLRARSTSPKVGARYPSRGFRLPRFRQVLFPHSLPQALEHSTRKARPAAPLTLIRKRPSGTVFGLTFTCNLTASRVLQQAFALKLALPALIPTGVLLTRRNVWLVPAVPPGIITLLSPPGISSHALSNRPVFGQVNRSRNWFCLEIRKR